MTATRAKPGTLPVEEHRAARLVAVAAAVVGLAASVYLTVEHYTHGNSFACPESATVNCLKVTTSKWATVAGVPVAVLGLAYFALMTAAVAVPLRQRRLRTLRLMGAGLGIVAALALIYVELFEVDAICLWCTLVHACALVLFGATVWRDSGS